MRVAQCALFVLALATAACISDACAAAESARASVPRFIPPRSAPTDAPKPGAIRFLTTDDFPPFNFVDGEGKLTGYNVELARAICARLAVPCTIQVRPFPLLVDALQRNTADAIIAGIADTPGLRAFLAHSAPYLRLPARFVMRKDGAVAAVPETLAGKKVAVVKGTRLSALLADFFPASTRIEAESLEAAFSALTKREVDAVLAGALPAAFWLAGPEAADCCAFAGGAYAEPAYVGKGLTIAVKADNEALKRSFDDTLRALEADGVMADLYLRFFPVGLY